jgi:hypothetical protein
MSGMTLLAGACPLDVACGTGLRSAPPGALTDPFEETGG